MLANYLYKVVVNKYNSEEKIEELHLIAENYLQACHIAEHYIFEAGKYPNTPVEVVSIVRDMSVKDIINSNIKDDDEYEVEDPFDVEGLPENEIMKFKHSCQNWITVMADGWHVIECPDCKEEIMREDYENVGGVWVYMKTGKKKK